MKSLEQSASFGPRTLVIKKSVLGQLFSFIWFRSVSMKNRLKYRIQRILYSWAWASIYEAKLTCIVPILKVFEIFNSSNVFINKRKCMRFYKDILKGFLINFCYLKLENSQSKLDSIEGTLPKYLVVYFIRIMNAAKPFL